MAKYIIKRVAMGIFSIFIVATVTFFVMNVQLFFSIRRAEIYRA